MATKGEIKAAASTGREPPQGQQWDRRLRVTIALLCGALFLDAMDVSSVNVALPTIGAHLGMTTTSLQWIVSAYVLGYGGFLLLGGRVSDLLGKKQVFLGALAVFAVASAVGGLADSGTVLIVTRLVKGIAAAFTVPAGLSILTTTFVTDEDRHRALGAYASTGAAGFSLGLVIGGLLSELGWRYVFLVPVPVTALVVLAGARYLQDDAKAAVRSGRRSYDLPGGLAVTGSMLSLVYTVVEAPTHGWGAVRTLIGFAVSAMLAVAFVAIERTSKQPLLRLGILRNRSLLAANIGGSLYFGSFLGFQFLATLYVQSVAHWSPVSTALAFLPSGAFLPILGAQAPRLIGRFGTPKLVAAGLVAFAAGYALFLREDSPHLTYVTMLLPSMIVLGIGWGIAYPALNVQATAGVDGAEQGLAAGLLSTSLQIGGAVLVAIVSAVISSRTGDAGGNEAAGVLHSITPALTILIPVAAAGAAAVLALSRPRATALATAGGKTVESLIALEAFAPAAELCEAA